MQYCGIEFSGKLQFYLTQKDILKYNDFCILEIFLQAYVQQSTNRERSKYLYILETLLMVKSNFDILNEENLYHNYNTRHNKN